MRGVPARATNSTRHHEEQPQQLLLLLLLLLLLVLVCPFPTYFLTMESHRNDKSLQNLETNSMRRMVNLLFI